MSVERERASGELRILGVDDKRLVAKGLNVQREGIGRQAADPLRIRSAPTLTAAAASRPKTMQGRKGLRPNLPWPPPLTGRKGG